MKKEGNFAKTALNPYSNNTNIIDLFYRAAPFGEKRFQFFSLFRHGGRGYVQQKLFHAFTGELLLFRSSELVVVVLEKLSKSEEHIRDGMDICLIRLDKRNKKEIQYSGANRSLIIIKNNSDLQELKADKQPVGNYDNIKP